MSTMQDLARSVAQAVIATSDATPAAAFADLRTGEQDYWSNRSRSQFGTPDHAAALYREHVAAQEAAQEADRARALDAQHLRDMIAQARGSLR
jgi:hypothetical protein